jgi:hypothetical protein
VNFEIIGKIFDPQIIAHGRSIREHARLRKMYGGSQWRKLKGIALVRMKSGRIHSMEINWNEARGNAKKEIKIKRYIS